MLGILVCSTVSRNKVVSLKLSMSWVGRVFFRIALLITKLSGLFLYSVLSFYPVDSYLTKISSRNCE